MEICIQDKGAIFIRRPNFTANWAWILKKSRKKFLLDSQQENSVSKDLDVIRSRGSKCTHKGADKPETCNKSTIPKQKSGNRKPKSGTTRYSCNEAGYLALA